MDTNEFREFGKAAVDFIADYLENVRDLNVLPSVSPGYLSELLPETMPNDPENWRTIMEDIKRHIIPGLTHWQSPNFHAYFPTETSYPSIVGEMMAAGFGVLGFTWLTSPVCTELEVIVMDWLGKFLNLPKQFLASSQSSGGGIIQGSASEAVLVALLSAREQVVRKYKDQHPEISESDIRGKLVAYSSDQSNSCVERAGIIATVPIRLIPADEELSLDGKCLENAITDDINHGKIPVICIATTGSTATCAYDNIKTIGEVCKKYNIWLHVDAAYAAVGYCLPEYRHLLEGLELADSLNFNLNKSIRVNFDCTAMWLKNSEVVVDSLMVDRIYLKHKYQGQNPKAPDYRNWQIPLGRRFRALKVWMVMKSYGAEGIRQHVRNSFDLTDRFEKYVLGDCRFETFAKRTLGLVCFRLKGENRLTQNLLTLVTERKKIYIIHAEHKGLIFLRFAVCGFDPKSSDIDFAWKEIASQADIVLNNKFRQRNTE